MRNRTLQGWALFFAGFLALLIADRISGGSISHGVFRAAIYALMAPSLYLVYKGTRGKGGKGLRALLTVTHFWLGYALAALVWLIASKL